jgi:hypothetical protein
MTNLASALQPAIDALEQDLTDLERRGNALLVSINVLREKAGLPPRPGGFSGFTNGVAATGTVGKPVSIAIHSDTFLGKKLGTAVREYLEKRKASGGDAPATPREIFDSLKLGGFAFGSKDETTALTVLRAVLRKRTEMFHRLDNGRYGLRSWYGDLPRRRTAVGGVEPTEAQGIEADAAEEPAAAETGEAFAAA